MTLTEGAFYDFSLFFVDAIGDVDMELFDIDGTLVAGPTRGPSAGLLSMNRAAFLVTRETLIKDPAQVQGLTDLEIATRFRLGNPNEFAGRTDPQIARRLIELVEKTPPREDRVKLLVDHYLEGLPIFIDEYPYRPLGDPRGAVESLREAGAVVGLGTGNVPEGARLKLESCGILHLFDIDLGGYGDNGDTRAEVIRRGALRCDPSGDRPIVVVGDTPRDVEAALAIGAVCVGVPFHANTRKVLMDAGAAAVVDEIGPSLVPLIGDLIGT